MPLDEVTIPTGHVPAGQQHDGETPKYLAGFRAAVKSMMGPQPHRWVEQYGEPARIAQLLQQAYQRGLIDGWSLRVPVDAPGPVAVEAPGEPETTEGAVARLDLFEAASVPPVLSSVALEPLGDRDWYVWMVEQTRRVMGMSLIEADEFVSEVME